MVLSFHFPSVQMVLLTIVGQDAFRLSCLTRLSRCLKIKRRMCPAHFSWYGLLNTCVSSFPLDTFGHNQPAWSRHAGKSHAIYQRQLRKNSGHICANNNM
jgi:hypothetical protein